MKRYLEIYREIAQRIRAGEWNNGEKLPGELELIRQYRVSRATLRMALRVLEDEKWLTTRQGVGRYVNHRRSQIVSNLARLESTEAMLRRSGSDLQVRVIEYVDIELSRFEAHSLEVPEGSPGKRLVRTRSVNQQPAFVSVNLFRGDCAPASPIEGSLLKTFEQQLGKAVDYARSTITLPQPDDRFARLLYTEGDFTPIVRLQQLHFSWKHEPLFLSYDYVNTNLVTLAVTRKRDVDT